MKFSSKTKSRIIIALSLAFFLLFSVALWSVFRVRENSAFAETDATKIATALNGAAWLHAGPGVDAARLRAMLRAVQTSSPSFVTLLALDDMACGVHGIVRRASRKS